MIKRTIAAITLTALLGACTTARAPQPPAIAAECLAQEKDGVSGFCEGDTCYMGMVRDGTLYLWETKQRVSPGRYSMFFKSDGKAATFGTLRGDAVPEEVPAVEHPAGRYAQFMAGEGYPHEQRLQYEFRRVAQKFAEFARPK